MKVTFEADLVRQYFVCFFSQMEYGQEAHRLMHREADICLLVQEIANATFREARNNIHLMNLLYLGRLTQHLDVYRQLKRAARILDFNADAKFLVMLVLRKMDLKSLA